MYASPKVPWRSSTYPSPPAHQSTAATGENAGDGIHSIQMVVHIKLSTVALFFYI